MTAEGPAGGRGGSGHGGARGASPARAGEAARAFEERLRALWDAAPSLVWVADASGACTYVNRAWREFTGRPIERELGEGWLSGVHRDDRERRRRAMRSGEPFEVEYRLRHRSGEHRWILDRGSPIDGGAGPTGMIGVCVDVHERHVEEERHAFLAGMAEALDAEAGGRERLEALAGLLVERLCDVCVAEVVGEDGDLWPLTWAAGDPELEALVAGLGGRSPLPLERYGAARRGRPVRMAEVAADALASRAGGLSPEAAAVLRARPPRCGIVVPLRARGRVLGVLAASVHGPCRLGDGDVALVEEAGRRAGRALDDARLLEEAHATSRQLRRLHEATAALSSAATPPEVGAVAIARARELAGADAASLFEVDAGHLVVLARDRRAGEDLGAWARIPLDARVPAADAARVREAVWLEGPGAWRERYPGLASEAERRGIGGAGALPLLAGEQVVGALTLIFRAPRRVSRPEQDVLRVLAEASGQALARARLQRDAERQRERAELLAEVSFALDAAPSVEEQLRRLTEVLVPRVADLVTVRLAAGGRRSRLAEVAHVDPALEPLARDLYSRYTAVPGRPGPERVIATGRPELVADATEAMGRAYAPDAAFADGLRRLAIASYVSLPLIARDVVLGALTLMTTAASGRRYGPAELVTGEEIARRAALAIDNARRYEGEQRARAAAERARRRTERLQHVTAALSAAVGEEQVSRAVVHETMAALSAVAGVVALREGSEGRVLVAVGYPEDLLSPGQAIPLDGPFPLSAVLSRGEELWLESPEDWTRRFPAPRPGLGAAGIALPLRIGGEVVGAIAVRFGQDVRRFSAADRGLALAMAAQCAQALERARLYEAERHAADVLQRALLPAALPSPGIARLAVSYLPAAGGRAGGDFYDVVELPDGALSLVVGDVVGQGTEAAAVMGQLRSAWRAFALEGAGPATLVRRLSRFAERLEGARVATVACAVLAGDVLRYACAGHPPPLLRRGDAAPEYLLEGRGPPLAVGDGPPGEGRLMLGPGSLLLLYTDGVVERGRDIERGMAALADLVARAPVDPAAVLARVAEDIGSEPADDCALLALLTSGAPSPLALAIPAEPRALADARAAMRGWLEAAGLDVGSAQEVVLAASEALTNAVEHAYVSAPGPATGAIAVEMVREQDGTVCVLVRDSGRWRPPHAPPGVRGRGLALMRALMDAVDVETGEAGTTVRMRRGPRAGAGPEPAGPRAGPVPDGAVRLDRDIDLASAAELGLRLRDLAARRGGQLVLDLGGAAHLGSVGVRLLVDLADDLRRQGGGLRVIAPPGTIARRVLDLTGLDETIPVVSGPEDR